MFYTCYSHLENMVYALNLDKAPSYEGVNTIFTGQSTYYLATVSTYNASTDLFV